MLREANEVPPKRDVFRLSGLDRCAIVASMSVYPGMTIGERFWLETELGRGGMGSVWRARHLSLQCWCALKFIEGANANDPKVRERFWREAHAAAQIRSPHIVAVWDFGEWQGIPYLVMEYLEGQSLRARLDHVGRLSPAACVALMQQVSRGLTRAHNEGMIHRDLKPSNLFLCKDDDREIAKIIDFGIVKHVGSSAAQLDKLTKTDTVLGTIHYLSPEQAQGSKAIDHRSDVWALGVIAFECLVGRKPFQGGTVGELLINLMISPLPMPSQLAPDLPPALDAWWERAAAREVPKRFSSVREMVDALAQALGVGVLEPTSFGEGSPSVLPPTSVRPASNTPSAIGSSRDEPTKTSVSAASAGVSSASTATVTKGPRIAVAIAAVMLLLTLGGVGLAARNGLLSSNKPATADSATTPVSSVARVEGASKGAESNPAPTASAPAPIEAPVAAGAKSAEPTSASPAPVAAPEATAKDSKGDPKASRPSAAKPATKGKPHSDDEYLGF